MKKFFFAASFLVGCGLFATNTSAPILIAKLSRKALTELVPGPEHKNVDGYFKVCPQNTPHPQSDSEYQAHCLKQTFIDLLSEAKDRILSDPLLENCSRFSFKEVKDKLSEAECQILGECAEAYYREKPGNSTDFGYRSSVEFAKHYKRACTEMGIDPKPVSSERLFFEILAETKNSLMTYTDFARGEGYSFFIADEMENYGSFEEDQKAKAEAEKAKAEADRAKAEAAKAWAEADRAKAEAEKAWREAQQA